MKRPSHIGMLAGAAERVRTSVRRLPHWFRDPRSFLSGAGAVAAAGLFLGLLILLLPWLWADAYQFLLSSIQQFILGLIGLILVFSVYLLHQQRVLRRMRGQLDEEMAERTRLQTEMQEFQQWTLLDPLTGLYNRHFLEQHLAAEVARAQRHGYQLNVLKLDLRGFRQINTRYGPPAGDCVLKLFSERLRKSLRNSDLSVRTGSDEFLVLLPESSHDRVPHILTRLSGLEVELQGEKVAIEFAAGWTAYEPGEQPQELLARADRELLADKHTGHAQQAMRQAHADLRHVQAVETLGRLAGRVAHDFNNLLSLVKGYSELALDSLGGTDPMRGYIEQIHEANERASSLTRQLLAFGRSHEAERELVDLNVMVASMEPMVHRLLGNQIELVIAHDPEAGFIHGNRGQIEQIVLDLAVNARDAMPQGGRLTVETRNVQLDDAFVHWHAGARPGSYVLLSVLDTGAGINAEEREHLFEPFPASPDKTKKKSGLGLASVYGIVKQCGGYVWVDSEPGLGTRFAIYLPRVEKPVGVASA